MRLLRGFAMAIVSRLYGWRNRRRAGVGPAGYLQRICRLREYERSAEAAQKGIRLFPDFPNSYRWLAAALGQLGRSEEAKEAPGKAIAVAPASFDTFVRHRVPWHRAEDHAHMVEGLLKAGLS